MASSTASTGSTRFGELLRRHRQAAGLTQAELAERAGLSVRGINDLERGVRQAPRKDTVALLAQGLGLSDAERAAFTAAARRTEVAPAAASSASPPSANRGEASSPALPTGTVTFLFADLEGSTRLLQQLGTERYAHVLASVQRLLRAAIAAHGGRVVDSQGDSCFIVSSTAGKAVAAAAEAQRAVAAHPWPEGAAVRVRMGLHTGAAQVVGERYIGLDVHRAARIAAAGHGGQVLLSEAARGLVEDALPEGATLRDLGAHRLKDLQRPEHLFQLVLGGLPGMAADFPLLPTLDAHPHNLPIQPTPLLGREQEVAVVCALLRREEVRLVTLTGVGGVGKTRLGLQVAAELVDAFADGVWFVRLSRLSDSALVLPTIAQTLGLREAGSVPLAALLHEYVRTRHLLLLLDNFEQVMAAAPQVADLLATSPGLTILVTSRAVLHLRGEREVPVPPLGLPSAAEAQRPPAMERLAQYAAVALFIARACDARPDFQVTNATAAAVLGICARLDGLPLAIELAAARVKVLPPPVLLLRLERRLPLLTGGARDLEARQQTLYATLAWSEDLLQPEEQRLFHRLAVFVGGFTLEAAEAVCAAPHGAAPLGMGMLQGLEALVDQSLVQPWTVDSADGTRGVREEKGEEEEVSKARVRLLFVVREYALERLEASGEAEMLRRAHAVYYLELAETVEPQLWRVDRVAWLDRLEREHDNFRAALGWAREHGEAGLGLRLASALLGLWFTRGHLSEGRRWTEGLLEMVASNQADATGPQEKVSAEVRARALLSAGWFATAQADFGSAAALLEAAATAAQVAENPEMLSGVHDALGALAYYRGDLAQAEAQFEEFLALSRGNDDLNGMAGALSHLGEVVLHRGDLARARALSEEALMLARRSGELEAEVNTLCILGQIAWQEGDLPTALALHRQGLSLARTLGDPFRIADTFEYLANVVGAANHGEQAARLLGAAAVLREAIGSPQTSVGRALTERAVAEARAALGEERWAAAFATGRALSQEDTIAEALGEIEDESDGT